MNTKANWHISLNVTCPWVTPTYEDIKLHPKAQFSDDEEFKEPRNGILIGVVPRCGYICNNGADWLYCRVKKSELERLRGEKDEH